MVFTEQSPLVGKNGLLNPHSRMRMINTKAVHIHKHSDWMLWSKVDKDKFGYEGGWLKATSLGIQCDSEHGLFPISTWLILQIRDNVVKEETVLSLLSTQHIHQPSHSPEIAGSVPCSSLNLKCLSTFLLASDANLEGWQHLGYGGLWWYSLPTSQNM